MKFIKSRAVIISLIVIASLLLTPFTAFVSPWSSVYANTASSTSESLKVQFYNYNTSAVSNTVYPQFKLINTGSTSINLTNIKMRYYYTIDGDKAQTFWCDWSTIGKSNITGTFVKMPLPRTGSDYYLEIGFTGTAGYLPAGANVIIQTRFSKSDWSNYTQTGDYSFNSTASSYVDWNKVTGYSAGILKWGTEPVSILSTPTPVPTPTPTPVPTLTPTPVPTPTPTPCLLYTS
ncbi:MAG: 1,4-beta-glucanase, partial [Clostridia bacterium]|nr:1,4-beta-glucanase [Clostridia bacterium]